MGFHVIRMRMGRAAILLGATALLAACEDGQGFDFLKKKDADTEVASAADAGLGSANLVEREVEAPDVFQANEDGLWDGRPSLGGVWVAYPGVKDPERVVIRNMANNKSVIGALFRRERDNPGPKLQLSSDAAEALGLLAGQPTRMSVVALRTETIPVAQPAAPISDPEGTEALPAPDAIEAQSLDPVAAAEAAIAKSEALAPGTSEAALPKATTTAAAAAPVPKPAPTRKAPSGLAKPFIQIGIFSVKANADNTATALRGSGILPTVKKGSSQGKAFHRVIVGPASSSSERATLLRKVKELGFTDAYFVTN